jgi:hypothetical protein
MDSSKLFKIIILSLFLTKSLQTEESKDSESISNPGHLDTFVPTIRLPIRLGKRENDLPTVRVPYRIGKRRDLSNSVRIPFLFGKLIFGKLSSIQISSESYERGGKIHPFQSLPKFSKRVEKSMDYRLMFNDKQLEELMRALFQIKKSRNLKNLSIVEFLNHLPQEGIRF